MMRFNKRFFNKLKWNKLKKDFIELISGISFREILIFLLFPILITILMCLPLTIRESLSLHIYNPKGWQFFTHAFVHKDFNHFWSNLLGYIMVGPLLLIFANKIKEKKSLFLLLLLTLIFFPLISSMIEILIYPRLLPNLKISCGSSGIISALIGFIPVFWIYYFSKIQKANLINLNFLWILFSYIGFSFAVISHLTLPKILLFLSLLFLFIFLYRKNIKLIFIGIREEFNHNKIFYLTILLLLFFIFAPLILFPIQVAKGGKVTDSFMHYVGLCFGIIFSFSFFKIKHNKIKEG